MSYTIHFNPLNGEGFILPQDSGSPEDIAAAKAKLATAIIGMSGVRKNANNPAFKSKYANCAAVLEVIGEALDPKGLALTTSEVSLGSDRVKMAFIIIDSANGCSFVAGYSSTYKPEKAGGHGTGSAETYAVRRGGMTIFCIAAEDDDGNAASTKGQPNYSTARSSPVGGSTVNDLEKSLDKYAPPGVPPSASRRPPGM